MNNLVEKTLQAPSADLGSGSTRGLSDFRFGLSRDSSTDLGFGPQPVNHGQGRRRLADSARDSVET